MSKIFQVVVVFSFGGIDDPNGAEADAVVDEVSNRTVRYLLEKWEAPLRAVWVDEAYVSEDDEDEEERQNVAGQIVEPPNRDEWVNWGRK